MNIKILIFFTCIAASSQTLLFFGQDGLIHKAAQKVGISNIINVEGGARAKLGQNEVDVDAAIGVGESGVGAHGSANADVLGQKARINADILNGQKIDQHNHEVYLDNQNRQYILQREYIGSNYVYVRKYLNDGQIYLAKPNNANTIQQQRDRDNQQYDQYQGKYVPQAQYVVQESNVPKRQHGYVQPEGYVSDNYQPRNYDHRPGSLNQQSEQYDQHSGQYDQQSGQYDHQYERHDQQSSHYNHQSRHYNEKVQN